MLTGIERQLLEERLAAERAAALQRAEAERLAAIQAPEARRWPAFCRERRLRRRPDPLPTARPPLAHLDLDRRAASRGANGGGGRSRCGGPGCRRSRPRSDADSCPGGRPSPGADSGLRAAASAEPVPIAAPAAVPEAPAGRSAVRATVRNDQPARLRAGADSGHRRRRDLADRLHARRPRLSVEELRPIALALLAVGPAAHWLPLRQGLVPAAAGPCHHHRADRRWCWSDASCSADARSRAESRLTAQRAAATIGPQPNTAMTEPALASRTIP